MVLPETHADIDPPYEFRRVTLIRSGGTSSDDISRSVLWSHQRSRSVPSHRRRDWSPFDSRRRAKRASRPSIVDIESGCQEKVCVRWISHRSGRPLRRRGSISRCFLCETPLYSSPIRACVCVCGCSRARVNNPSWSICFPLEVSVSASGNKFHTATTGIPELLGVARTTRGYISKRSESLPVFA